MAKRYEGLAQFFVVYIKEAHPSDEWRSQVNPRLTYIKDPATFYDKAWGLDMDSRLSCQAKVSDSDLEIEIPCLVDDMDNTAARAYKGWPDRMFIVGADGLLKYVGLPGPFGFLPSEMEAALRVELGLD